MSLRRIPVDAKRKDWPRLVAEAVNNMIGKIEVDPIARAENTIYSTYGDSVSVAAKGKTLNKFGRNLTVGTSFETIAELQGTTANETFVSTNIIDSIVSDAAGDTSLTVTIEGHTIDASGNLTFVSQNATTDATNGTTEVALTTPLARANRIFVANSGTFDSPQSAPSGNIYVYDNTAGITSGVPNTAAATKLMLIAGATQSEKCATSISSGDYWIINYFGAGIGETGAASVNYIRCRMEIRNVASGGVWRPLGADIVIAPGTAEQQLMFDPPLVVPKNHDWRVVARTDASTVEVFAEAGGYLAAVQG